MTSKKINIKTVLIYILCFLILLFPFNSTIANKIYPMYSLVYISIIIAMFLLMILGNVKKINKKQLIILLFIMIVGSIEFFTNKYVSPIKKMIYTPCLLLPLLVTINKETIKAFIFNIKLFAVEHMTFTYIGLLFRDFYINNILPFLDLPGSLARSHYIDSGFNPGITTHYSTNGMYMSIFCILFFVEYINNKGKKNRIKLILALIALLVVGKKGAVLFTIMSFAISYFAFNKDKISKRIGKFIMIAISFILLVYISASFIPQVTIVFDRVISTFNNNGDILTGRGLFYQLALKLWNNNILFGCGWGNFSNYYQIELVQIFGVDYLDAHNVYLQLLCETGIVGATLIIGVMTYCALGTFKQIKIGHDRNLSLKFSFAYQVFFLLYCFSGNPLYDAQCYILYFICIGIFLYTKINGVINNEQKN